LKRRKAGIKTPPLNPTKGEVTAVREKSDEKQCAKIAADFLVEGKKGVDLEAADAGLGTGRGTYVNVSVLRACFDLVRRYLPTCRTFQLKLSI
jgi:hypothetical protein